MRKAMSCVLVLPLLALPAAQVPLRAGGEERECKFIEARLTSVADLSTFTTRGRIRGDLNGTTEFIGDAASLMPIAGPASPPLNPSFSYTGDLVITTRQGTLRTRSVGAFEFLPFGAGTQFDRVIGGTGKYRGATGLLFFNFIANGDLSGFTSSVRGELCLAENGGEDR